MLQPPTILVVDDDDDIRTILGRLFSTLGFRVQAAADGYTAFILARQLTPALIVLDLGLPGRDGWTVAREMRADPALEQTPIMAITAYGSSAALRTARAAGCQEVICKPFALETLVETARMLLAAP
jgi:CheY-like chemotaxis protein